MYVTRENHSMEVEPMRADAMRAALPLAGLGLLGVLASPGSSEEGSQNPVRLGLVGLDTSHVVVFTAAFNDPANADHVPGVKVVAAYKGGSRDIESSWSRVEGYAQELHEKWGVELVDSIEELCTKVDGVLIESVDGRPHLDQARPVIAAGLPFFVDKPVAGTLADGIEMARLAQEKSVPWFGGSSLRWYAGVREAVDPETVGEIIGCDAYSPCTTEPHHPDLFWYGTHGVSILYAAMGRGCKTVTRIATADTDVVVGVWGDGRIGTYRGTRSGAHDYGATVFGTKAVATARGVSYRGLLEQIVRFFQTKEPPVPAEELLEELAFMEAADRSKAQGGVAVEVAEIKL